MSGNAERAALCKDGRNVEPLDTADLCFGNAEPALSAFRTRKVADALIVGRSWSGQREHARTLRSKQGAQARERREAVHQT